MTALTDLQAQIRAERMRLGARETALTRIGRLAKSLEGAGLTFSVAVSGQTIGITIELGAQLALPAPDTDPGEASAPEPPPARAEGKMPEQPRTPAAPAPGIAIPTPTRSGGWCPRELAVAREVALAGGTAKDVASRCPDRTLKACEVRLVRIRKELRAEGHTVPTRPPFGRRPAPAAVQQKPANKPERQMSGPASAPAATAPLWQSARAFDPSTPAADRAIEAHLNALGYKAPWDAGLDFEMFELLSRGTFVAEAAKILEVTRPDLIERCRALRLDDKIDTQTRTLAALKRRAGKEQNT